jgi:hypothetical protein
MWALRSGVVELLTTRGAQLPLAPPAEVRSPTTELQRPQRNLAAWAKRSQLANKTHPIILRIDDVRSSTLVWVVLNELKRVLK